MKIKKIVGKLHLWLGLASGLVVFIVSLTGCLIVFEEEICTLFQVGVFQKVEVQAAPYEQPSTIFSVADSVLAGKKIARTYYTAYMHKPAVTALWALDSTRQYHAVLQNPYTAAVVETYPYKVSFFAIMTHIHTSLAMGKTGTYIVGSATLIFVVLMITGIILWKPASKKGYKQRFTIKWNASGKRLNYDLHNVLGFYMAWVAIFIAITGLIWSFEWVNSAAKWVANGGSSGAAAPRQYFSDTSAVRPFNYRLADSIYAVHASDIEKIDAIRVYKPSSYKDVLRFTIETREGSTYARADEYLYDQYSGKLISYQPFADLSNGDKLQRMNYYIHMGSIGGLTGKMLAFFASLIATSLPVTGFLVWRGRRRRKKQVVLPGVLNRPSNLPQG
ncbi:PepSY-associated TM helix domain-containing protein [Chitinophaga alhagiae]|uniref:PepSY-associated TM helix domain-containing protein n=1 Tax=Chitinophaga alhagiae TaxID=2203219 RepID=UPI0013006230|nr:PepSY-associated TM helix domain-containing protein [Chitinophaga alhagiae]